MKSRPSTVGNTIAVLLLILVGGAGNAVDVEFGADALPVLIDRSDSVAIARRIELVERGRGSIAVYNATIETVIAGRRDIGTNISIAVPRFFTLEDSALRRAGHIVFLIGPVEPRVALSLIGRDTAALYWLAAGSYGRIDETDERVAAVRSYAAFQADERKFPWVQGQLGTGDGLLQRSALLELAKPRYSSDGEKYDLLRTAAVDPRTADSTKNLALELLAISESPRALSALRDVATDEATTPGRVAVAIRSLGSMEGGDAVLRELQRDRRHRAVRGLATAELEPLRGTRSGTPSFERLLADLGSADRKIRSQAIHDLRRVSGTEATIPVVARLVSSSANTTNGERAELIDHLAALDSATSARVLSDVARDRSQSVEIRNAAILALTQMNDGAALDALRQLSVGLEDGPSKTLAETVLN